jgi:outer membrane protein
MIKFNYIIVIFLTIISFNLAKANENIYFIDLDYLINESLAGKSITVQLKKEHDNNLSFFKKNENDMKERESKIISQKNVLNESEFKEKINKLSIDIKKYNKVKKNKINLINKRMVESKRKLLIEINLIIGEYSKNKSISMVIQKKNIIIGKTELDITIPIFKILNNSIKTIKIK